MKKLERLNLDIEEALSAGSSPLGTPSAKRHKQPVGMCVWYYMFSNVKLSDAHQATVFRSACVSGQAEELRFKDEVSYSFNTIVTKTRELLRQLMAK